MFRAWPKIPRLENEVYHITEKLMAQMLQLLFSHCHIFQKEKSLHIPNLFLCSIQKQQMLTVFGHSPVLV